MWNGTAETLKARPATTNTRPMMVPISRRLAGEQRLRDLHEGRAAAEAVDQRGAEQQHAGGDRAQDEVLHAGLGRAHGIALEGGDHVERQRLQLEPDIERHQVVGRDHQHHAERGQRHEQRILEAPGLDPLEIGARHQDGDRRADQHQRLHGRGKPVDDEQRGEGGALAVGHEQQDRRHQQGDRGRDRDEGVATSPRTTP